MHRLVDTCRVYAGADATVLLLGETGTGKEVVARLLHDWSDRRSKPFVAINCAALPDTLLESEMFGHDRGAFTSATRDKPGHFEQASGGTMFLDEIAEMSPQLQAKLLRVLEDGTFRRVGATRSRTADVRIIAATNRKLLEEIQAGRFRADLYYRLNVLSVDLPTLAERVSDIPQLVAHFLEQHARKHRLSVPSVEQDAMDALLAHRWPGNVRELRNVVERCVVLSRGEPIRCEHLPREVRGDLENSRSAPVDNRSKIDVQERAMVAQALRDSGWNKAAAARSLGISWDNLRYRIKKYGIKPDRP